MVSQFTLFLGILVLACIQVSLSDSITPGPILPDFDCSKYNKSCSECVSASLNLTQGCYYCGDSCLEIKFSDPLSFRDCPIDEFFFGQCSLSLLGITILSSIGFLCYCGSCLFICICACCCCCFMGGLKGRSGQPQQYTRLVNNNEDQKQRDSARMQRNTDIKARYGLNKLP